MEEEVWNMRTNKKRILLSDLDDVLNTFNPHWINQYNKKYKQNLTESDIADWDLHKFTLPNVDVFKEFIYKKHLFKKNNFFRTVRVQPYAQEVTRELLKYFDIYEVSASHFSTVEDKAEWLVENFSHIPIKNFIPCYNKNMIKGECLIDDGYHNLINFDGKRILFDKPWNRQYQNDKFIDKNDIKVIRGWKDYEGIIKYIYEV